MTPMDVDAKESCHPSLIAKWDPLPFVSGGADLWNEVVPNEITYGAAVTACDAGRHADGLQHGCWQAAVCPIPLGNWSWLVSGGFG